MTSKVYLGIDLGSSNLKALAIDGGSGAALASAGQPLCVERSPMGGCQVAAAALAQALRDTLRSVVAQLGARAAAVHAIGCTGHGAGLYAMRADGRLAADVAVASTDQRATQRVAALTRRHGRALFDEVGCEPWAGQPTMIAAELRACDPQRLHGVRHLMFAKDYLGYLLSGEIATDFSDASTAGLIALADAGWSRRAFEVAGLEDWLPCVPSRLVRSGTVIGHLTAAQAAATGLPAGIKVAMGAIDLLAAMTGAGAIGPGQAVAVLGTWCVNAVIGPAIEPKPAVGGVVDIGRPGLRLYMDNSPASMANLAWLAHTLQFADTAAVIDAAMSAPPLAHGLRFLPFVNGAPVPPGASAAFLGLKGHHSRADLARAVVEGVVALHVRHLGRLEAGGLPLQRVIALGGGARDARLAQLLATMLGRAVERAGDDETGARGAAMYAAQSDGIALGEPGCVLAAACVAVPPKDNEVASYADFGSQFDQLVEGLAPTCARLARVAP